MTNLATPEMLVFICQQWIVIRIIHPTPCPSTLSLPQHLYKEQLFFKGECFFFFSLIRWFDSVGRDIWLGRSLLELKLQQRKWCLIIMEVWCHLVWLLYFTHDSSPQDMWPVGFYNICSLKGTRIFDLNKIRWRLIFSVFWMSHIHITVSQTFTHLKRKWDSWSIQKTF